MIKEFKFDNHFKKLLKSRITFSKRKNGKKESQLKAGDKGAQCYKSRRVGRQPQPIMRTQQPAPANLAALFSRFRIGNVSYATKKVLSNHR